MKHTLCSLAVLASLLFSASTLFASPGDAASVLQSCGAPLSDSIIPGPSNDPNPQRLLQYRDAALHFQEDQGGWNFLYATTPSGDRRTYRAQTPQLLPCFQRAMSNVLASTTAQSTPMQPAATREQNFQQWVMQPVFGIRRLGFVPLLLLYLLPSLIAFFRRHPHARTIVVIDVLLGWTIIGWIYALLLSNQDPEDASSELDTGAIPLIYQDEAASNGVLHLNTFESEFAAEAATSAAPLRNEPRLLPREHAPRPARAAATRVEILPEPEPRYAPPAVPTPSPVQPIARTSPIGIAATPQPPTDTPKIYWTEQFSPVRRCRLDLASQNRQVTTYDVDLTQRGFDDDGREYLGGYSNRAFHVFPVEDIVHLHHLAA